MSRESDALRLLLGRLTTYKVLNWHGSSSSPDQSTDREMAEIGQSDVVSSESRVVPGRHALVIDIDHPAWLVKSTTQDHYHLYVDVPGGIQQVAYFELLNALAIAGVIERGYADASISRGFSSVRLPWIKKPQEQAPLLDAQAEEIWP